MMDREKVIKGLEWCMNEKHDCYREKGCPYETEGEDIGCKYALHRDALTLLKAQEARHRLEVHNIGNVDIPEGVTEEQFHAVMNNVVEALQHTDRGESWPYEEVKWDD